MLLFLHNSMCPCFNLCNIINTLSTLLQANYYCTTCSDQTETLLNRNILNCVTKSAIITITLLRWLFYSFFKELNQLCLLVRKMSASKFNADLIFMSHLFLWVGVMVFVKPTFQDYLAVNTKG